MSKKLNGNGLWESSRMMLPEHKESIGHHRHEHGRRPRPVIDEQEWELIGSRLQESMQEQTAITLEMYDPFESCQLTGIVLDVDIQSKRLRLLLDGEKQWVRIDDIIAIRET
ncbi:YolD-like family protein [Paenibacillus alvei]|uniref:YolD-like protein n=1 Tax=Paenibacillus alvei TaxID=44250 RepID=A0A383RCN9_PAEAL|nr:YolD-like family protein [Paenibacillus alvei]SYX84583.1 YolD-like protein [Paenibacillus alvei]